MCHRRRSRRRARFDEDLERHEGRRRRDRHRGRAGRRTRREARRSPDRRAVSGRGRRSTGDARYRRARRRAGRRLSVAIHGVVFASVLLMLFVVAGSSVALIVGAAWGIGLSIHAFVCGMAPDLRRRWIEQEMGWRPDGHRPEGPPMTDGERLIVRMGDDPRDGRNADLARSTLAELAQAERGSSPA